MKLTRACTYSLRAVVAMATEQDGQIVASHLTAQEHGIPEKFLLKVLHPLVKAGIMDSLKGPNGGYRLAKPAAKITLLEIIEAVDGPLRGEVPPAEAKGEQALIGHLKEICQRLTDHDRQELSKVTVAELVKGKGKARKQG